MTTNRFGRIAVIGAVSVMTMATSSFASGNGGGVFSLQTAVLDGQLLPGSLQPFVLQQNSGLSFSVPTMSSNGRLAINSVNVGLWYRDMSSGGSTTLYALNGVHTLAGGAAGAKWRSPERPVFDDLGRVAGGYDQGGGNGSSLLTVGAPGAFQQIAASGFGAPGVPGVNFATRGFQRPAVSPTGLIAFAGTTQAGFDGVWVNRPGQATSLVLTNGMQAPGLPAGTLFASMNGSIGGGAIWSDPAVNRSGQITFGGFLQQVNGVTSTTRNVLWAGTPENLSVVLRAGDILPGGIRFNGAGYAGINDAGVITAEVGVGTPSQSGILRVQGAHKIVLARVGQSGPGMAPGEVWRNSSSPMGLPLVNGAGKVLFSATFGSSSSPSQSGLWFGDDTDLQMIARSGSPVAGSTLPLGVVDGNNYVVNSRGDVVFGGWLDTAAFNAYGLFHWDVESGVSLIAAYGSTIETAPGVFKTIQKIDWTYFSGGQDGRASSLSDNGFFTFDAVFTDGTGGVFVTQVPAPGVGVGMIGAACIFAARHRRA